MLKDIKLFIGEQQVEFTDPVDILYTYQIDDLTNPTAIKNSFTKTLTIKGTPNNNKLFGMFWNLERMQGSGGFNGVEFNSSKKCDFMLYNNGELYESGYVKLNTVRLSKTNENDIEYDITLYGGLGDFFYNLSTDEQSGDKLTLADLDYLSTDNSENELNYTINIDTIKEAWENIHTNSGKWSVINFMPSYNGISSDFDAEHVIINTQDTTFEKTVKEDNVIYGTKNGWVLGNLPTALNEHEMRDYRSYLMRPVIRTKKVIEACCNPQNNGGYEVVLDKDFFNDNNPYWNDTYITLPLPENLELTNSGQELTGVTLMLDTTTGNEQEYMYQDINLSLGEFSSEMTDLGLTCKIKTDRGPYIYSTYVNKFLTTTNYLGSLFVQLLAYNGDKVIGASETYNLSSIGKAGSSTAQGTNDKYDYTGGKYVPDSHNTKILDVIGTFGMNGFKNQNGSDYIFNFGISNINAPVTKLKFRYFWGANKKKKDKCGGKNYLFDKTGDTSLGMNGGWGNVAASQISAEIGWFNMKAVVGESIGRTGTEITKRLLLKTKNSPFEYLVGYCKHFGLYFRKDVFEKKIYIETRNNFYKRNEIIDLTKLVDISQPIIIQPTVFDTKWIQFNPEYYESEFFTRYMQSEGVEYGSKLVNTGYEFNADKKNVMSGNAYKSAIEGHERSKYFSQYAGDLSIRPWMQGMTYNLYNGDDILERMPDVIGGKLFGINEAEGMKFYDLFPKVQFKNNNGSSLTGNDVLVFYSGMKPVNYNRANNVNYILSDDTKYQTALNEGKPCWMFTTRELDKDGNRICYKLNNIPCFERYLTGDGSNYVQYALDFGSPRQLFVQQYEYRDGANIYDNYWSKYLADLYDVNTRIMSCYVNTKDEPIYDWLRKFYWYNNSIWRINKISDWNVASPDLTLMEFVKVQDIESYTNNSTDNLKSLRLTLSKYTVGPDGETVYATVSCDSDVCWTLTFDSQLTINVRQGCGTQTFPVVVPKQTDNQVHKYIITARADISASATITQDTEGWIKLEERGNYVGMDIPETGGTVILNVKSVYNWTSDYTPHSDTIHFSTDRGNGDTENGENVNVVFDENNRLYQYTIIATYQDDYGNNATWRKTVLPITQIRYPYDGGCKTIDGGMSGMVFTVPDWISVVDNGDGTYDFCAKKNDSSERQNGVTGTYPSTRTEEPRQVGVIVIQDGYENPENPEINFKDDEFEFDKDGGIDSLCFETNGNWEAKPECDFIRLIPNTGNSGDTCITMIVDRNKDDEERDCQVCVTVGDVTKCVDVKQKNGGDEPTPPESELIVSPTILNYNDGCKIQAITIGIYGKDWYIDGLCDWLSTPEMSGSGYESVTFYTKKNETDEQRTCIFNVKDKAGKSVQVIANQSKCGDEPTPPTPSISFDKDNFDFESNGGTDTICITSNVDWEITNNPCYWVQLDKTSGGPGTTCIEIATTMNGGTAERNCTICVEYEGGSKCFKVNQQGSDKPEPPESCDLSVSRTSINLAWNYNNTHVYGYYIEVKSNCDWFVDDVCDWLSIETGKFGFDVKPINNNETESDRSCVLTVRTDYGDSKQLTVNQSGKPKEGCLTVYPTSLTFDASGGTTEIGITSCDDWTIE